MQESPRLPACSEHTEADRSGRAGGFQVHHPPYPVYLDALTKDLSNHAKTKDSGKPPLERVVALRIGRLSDPTVVPTLSFVRPRIAERITQPVCQLLVGRRSLGRILCAAVGELLQMLLHLSDFLWLHTLGKNGHFKPLT